jgi:hypothetical protein
MLSEDWLDNLSHESPETRHRYWLDLHRAVKTGRERLTFEDISLLLPLVAAEREAGQLPAWKTRHVRPSWSSDGELQRATWASGLWIHSGAIRLSWTHGILPAVFVMKRPRPT